MTTFGARLHAAVAERGPLCAGIDPHPGLLRATGAADDVAGARALRARRRSRPSRPDVAVVKPQSAFFERFGSRGDRRARAAVADCRAPAGALVLLDVKRGDIGSTMHAYAAAYLDPASPLAADADHGQPLPRLRLARPR